MNEENIDKLPKSDKDYVDTLVSSMENALVFRILFKNNMISESELNLFYDKIKILDLDHFRKQANEGTDEEYIQTVYNAYLETVELARENTLNAAKNDLYLK